MRFVDSRITMGSQNVYSRLKYSLCFKVFFIVLHNMLLGLVWNNKPVIMDPTWEADSSVEHGNAPELITFTSRDITF